nr:translation initiation factor IF-2-like [Manis javanica]
MPRPGGPAPECPAPAAPGSRPRPPAPNQHRRCQATGRHRPRTALPIGGFGSRGPGAGPVGQHRAAIGWRRCRSRARRWRCGAGWDPENRLRGRRQPGRGRRGGGGRRRKKACRWGVGASAAGARVGAALRTVARRGGRARALLRRGRRCRGLAPGGRSPGRWAAGRAGLAREEERPARGPDRHPPPSTPIPSRPNSLSGDLQVRAPGESQTHQTPGGPPTVRKEPRQARKRQRLWPGCVVLSFMGSQRLEQCCSGGMASPPHREPSCTDRSLHATVEEGERPGQESVRDPEPGSTL